MKKIFMTLIAAVILAGSIFAGGGGYFDDSFPDFTHVALDLTKYYENDFSDRDFYTVFDCEAVLADSGKKVELRTGTKLKIISIGNELKFCHDFDRNEYEDKINGIIYYDYLCEFTLDGKKYKGNVPGVYVSTSVKELVVGDGAKYFTEYELLSLTFASGQLFFRDLITCNSFEEVNIGIKNKLHDYMFFEEFHMNQKNRKLLTNIILNTKTQTYTDIYIQEGKFMSFPVAGTVSWTYEEGLPVPTAILCYYNFNGGFGGGTLEYTWYALNLENGKGFYICQCSYVSTEVCGGQHEITFDKRGCVLNVSEYDEDGRELQNSTETFAQDKKVPYFFGDNPDESFNNDDRLTKDYYYFNTVNLRIREAEDTSSKTKLVMKNGCKVKVVQIGKLDTIDGITSNWVKIEINSGKDKEGNKIRSGTSGWCFGGYLRLF